MQRKAAEFFRKNKNLLTGAFLCAVTLAYAALLFNLIDRHSVNLIFWDQWDFSKAIFGDPTAWGLFSHQHGPHRQGLGALLSLLVGTATGWNMRAEAFTIGAILVLSSLAALYLKYRLFGRLTPWDALIPAVCLNFIQCEIAFPNTNPGYTALPLLLVILSGITLTLKNALARYCLLAAVNFFAVFTGFSVFLGLLVPPISAYAAFVHRRNKERREMYLAAGAFLASVGTLALFFVGYEFVSAVDCFQFPHPEPSEYLVYVSNMLTMCQGFIYGYKATFAKPFGMVLFGVWLVVAFGHAWRVLKTGLASPASLVICTFLGFSIVYALNTAVGRVCLGTDYARMTRYMTLLIPGWLALYFAVLFLRANVLRWVLLALFAVLFMVIPLRQYNELDRRSRAFTEGREKWAECYVETEDVEKCDAVSGIKVHPAAEQTKLKEKLNLLKERRHNLFSEP